jgi:DNA-binding NarL/FixJ family response regulator
LDEYDPVPAVRCLHVLIVEDEFLVADYISDVVTDAGHQVVGLASSAEAALAIVAGSPIDLAIMDVRLSGDIDGVDLAWRLREIAPGAAYLFISGSGDPQTRERVQAAGPVAFLQKPFHPEQLVELINGLQPTGPTD